MLKVLDLFSGIAGFHLALRPFEQFETVAFCDIDQRARDVLESRMASAVGGVRLPTVPIHDDVREVTYAPGEIDMIVGGFPCVGFSALGKRKGTEHEGSGLVSEILRLVADAKPSLVFMENVGNITSFDEFAPLMKKFDQLGYIVRWTTLKAADVGAQHCRRRWWCLCIKRGTKIITITSANRISQSLFDWTTGEPPRLVDLDEDRGLRHNCPRSFLLGNSLVPSCAMVAFVCLWVGRGQATKQIKKTSWDLNVTLNGCFTIDPNLGKARNVNIVLDPAMYTVQRPPSPLTSTKILTEPVTIPLWATPRAGPVGQCNYLTERSKRDLPTQVRFATCTVGPRLLFPSGQWIDWLMGYPPGWTCTDEPDSDTSDTIATD